MINYHLGFVFDQSIDRLSGAMVLASCAVDDGFNHRSVKTNTMKLVFVDSQQSTQLQEVRTKTGWLEGTIMCPSGVTCPSIGC